MGDLRGTDLWSHPSWGLIVATDEAVKRIVKRGFANGRAPKCLTPSSGRDHICRRRQTTRLHMQPLCGRRDPNYAISALCAVRGAHPIASKAGQRTGLCVARGATEAPHLALLWARTCGGLNARRVAAHTEERGPGRLSFRPWAASSGWSNKLDVSRAPVHLTSSERGHAAAGGPVSTVASSPPSEDTRAHCAR